MLTKEHLKFSRRSGRIHPNYLDVKNTELLSEAEEVLQFYQQSIGESLGVINQNFQLEGHSASITKRAFAKLVDDLCEYDDVDENLADQRWDLLLKAKSLREQRSFAQVENFQMELAHANSFQSFEPLAKSLYGDLPEERLLRKALGWSAEKLIHRYNCAQIQGLLLRASALELTLGFRSAGQKRRFFQNLRFHRLLFQLNQTSSDERSVNLSLTGPLSIFEQTQVYGSRFANFFPHILNCPTWKISAHIELDRSQSLILELDGKRRPVQSHYRDQDAYIPEEYAEFEGMFNRMAQSQKKSKKSWVCAPTDEILPLSGNQICIPDFKLSTNANPAKTVYLELFHRWHHGQLKQRLKQRPALKAGEHLLLGICNSLKLDPFMKESLQEAGGSGISFFRFRGFPSPRAVLTQLRQQFS